MWWSIGNMNDVPESFMGSIIFPGALHYGILETIKNSLRIITSSSCRLLVNELKKLFIVTEVFYSCYECAVLRWMITVAHKSESRFDMSNLSINTALIDNVLDRFVCLSKVG